MPIDLPESIKKESAEFLAEPLTNIFNSCLKQGKYPNIWKQEFVTPVPKDKNYKVIKLQKDVRKIVSTYDYSKMFEHFLNELINKDISENLNKTQCGGKKGVRTEHLFVKMVGRIKKNI